MISGPDPRNLSAQLPNQARCAGVDSTKREQTARHRIIGQRNPQKETGLKNRSLHEGGRKSDDVEAKHLAG